MSFNRLYNATIWVQKVVYLNVHKERHKHDDCPINQTVLIYIATGSILTLTVTDRGSTCYNGCCLDVFFFFLLFLFSGFLSTYWNKKILSFYKDLVSWILLRDRQYMISSMKSIQKTKRSSQVSDSRELARTSMLRDQGENQRKDVKRLVLFVPSETWDCLLPSINKVEEEVRPEINRAADCRQRMHYFYCFVILKCKVHTLTSIFIV